jgi:hypothetical protein
MDMQGIAGMMQQRSVIEVRTSGMKQLPPAINAIQSAISFTNSSCGSVFKKDGSRGCIYGFDAVWEG